MPEEESEPLGLTEAPPDEHGSELPDPADTEGSRTQEENADSALDQPSDEAT
ncbi:hypothetical protein [Nocardioides coralli]|uniref:hypothetical protein n=1 Tax=Nocardioides coralli TaxID=2872154 RepID=UPI001CA3DC87|nr:hypothetical protein [Nocardioides coralli]QZY29647.1 hypothetical protein K6T13_02840 [Nocardioides coralli]